VSCLTFFTCLVWYVGLHDKSCVEQFFWLFFFKDKIEGWSEMDIVLEFSFLSSFKNSMEAELGKV